MNPKIVERLAEKNGGRLAALCPDKLTVARSDRPINKKIIIDADGDVIKKPALALYDAMARVVDVPDVHALASLLREVSDDPCAVILQGIFDVPDGVDAFRIRSRDAIEKAVGSYGGGFVWIDGVPTTARLKKNMRPSSWWLLDRDITPGMPDEMARLDDDEFFEAVDDLMPGFFEAGVVKMASTSGRVQVNGEPLESGGAHYWFQVSEPNDLGFGTRLLRQALVQGYGFMKPIGESSSRAWTLFDPTTFSHERVVYAGQPVVRGRRLTLGPPEIDVYEGGRVETVLIEDLTEAQSDAVQERFGLDLSANCSANNVQVQDGALRLDTVIQTKERGEITPREFLLSGDKRLRCQATFRESESWNGILIRGGNRLPLLFDNGTRTRYVLSDADKEEAETLYLQQVADKLSPLR